MIERLTIFGVFQLPSYYLQDQTFVEAWSQHNVLLQDTLKSFNSTKSGAALYVFDFEALVIKVGCGKSALVKLGVNICPRRSSDVKPLQPPSNATTLAVSPAAGVANQLQKFALFVYRSAPWVKISSSMHGL